MKKILILLLIFTAYTVTAYSRDYFFASEGEGYECSPKNPCNANDLSVLRNLDVGDRLFFQVVEDKWLYDPNYPITPKDNLWTRIKNKWYEIMDFDKIKPTNQDTGWTLTSGDIYHRTSDRVVTLDDGTEIINPTISVRFKLFFANIEKKWKEYFKQPETFTGSN